MKKIILFLTLLTISVQTMARGQNDGLDIQLTDAEIAELRPWAENSEFRLKEILRMSENYSIDDKISYLASGIEKLVIASAPRKSEILLRFALNRGLKIVDVIVNNTDGELNAKRNMLRVLERSIDFAITYYEDDIAFLTNGAYPKESLSSFGKDYALFFHDLVKTTLDASAQYELMLLNLHYLKIDLARSLEREKYAGEVLKINDALLLLPTTAPSSDQVSLERIRGMKQLIRPFLPKASFKRKLSYYANAKNDFKVKIGDIVLPDGWKVGDAEVIAYNAESKKFVVRYNYKNYEYRIENLGVRKGCIHSFCVGDQVIPAAWDVVGTIFAVNPYTEEIRVHYNYKYYTFSYDRLASME